MLARPVRGRPTRPDQSSRAVLVSRAGMAPTTRPPVAPLPEAVLVTTPLYSAPKIASGNLPPKGRVLTALTRMIAGKAA